MTATRPLAWTWSWVDLGVSINVDEHVRLIFEKNRQTGVAHERGGQLFVDLDQPDGLWLFATDSHPADRAGLTWLELDEKRCRSEIVDANSRGLRLIGYWHTHPEPIPQPSMQDIRSLRAFSARNQRHLRHPLAVIVGQAPKADSIRAWSLREQSLALADQALPEHTTYIHASESVTPRT